MSLRCLLQAQELCYIFDYLNLTNYLYRFIYNICCIFQRSRPAARQQSSCSEMRAESFSCFSAWTCPRSSDQLYDTWGGKPFCQELVHRTVLATSAISTWCSFCHATVLKKTKTSTFCKVWISRKSIWINACHRQLTLKTHETQLILHILSWSTFVLYFFSPSDEHDGSFYFS